VTPNFNSDDVSILLWNETSGAWDAQITKSVGGDPLDVNVGDANNDGLNDIVAANFITDNVSILLWNETSGAWDAQITKSVGGDPCDVEVGDANNDGENDIVVANYWDNTTSILLWKELVPPTWDEPLTDQTIEFGQSFFYDVNASDPSRIDRYWVDDTINFTIDGEGVITNNTALSIGDYRLLIYVNDMLGNENSAEIKITVEAVGNGSGGGQISGYLFIPLLLTISLSVAVIVRVKFGKER